jgi:hypothetical protein
MLARVSPHDPATAYIATTDIGFNNYLVFLLAIYSINKRMNTIILGLRLNFEIFRCLHMAFKSALTRGLQKFMKHKDTIMVLG